MLFVACASYLCSLEVDACDRRRYGNFFSGLFHDLPEVLTRDIISPIKHSVAGLDDIIKEYEHMQVEESLLPLLPEGWRSEIEYFIMDEFSNRIILDGRVVTDVAEDEMATIYNENRYSPIDGRIIRACDELAAFLEAHLSIGYGIRAPHLLEAERTIPQKYKNAVISGIAFGRLFEAFLRD
jgi:putative hydrolase of HD superfamily